VINIEPRAWRVTVNRFPLVARQAQDYCRGLPVLRRGQHYIPRKVNAAATALDTQDDHLKSS